MKTKRVVYQSLFNPEETFDAPNKILDSEKRMGYTIREFVRLNTRCKCRHPTFTSLKGGVCSYRKCNHSEAEHYATL